MKINKVKKQVSKINNLLSSIEMDGEMSSIEKDLLKSYILELYERVNITDSKLKSKKVEKPLDKNTNKKSQKDPKSIFSPEKAQAKVKSDTLEKVVEKELQTAANGTSSHLDIDAVIDIQQEHVEESDESIPAIDTDKLAYIFELESNNELSDKLSKLPIANLNKAIGLNEKIFTINELFKGNGAHYQEVMQHLNTLAEYEEARDYLTKHVVDRYDWTEDNRIKKAANFVKIIHRRYL